MLEKNDTENTLIQEFIDSIFWESSEIYLESMQKFVSREWSGSQFVSTILFLILDDKGKSELLTKDFERQARLELNPKIFQFSEIICSLELAFD